VLIQFVHDKFWSIDCDWYASQLLDGI